MLMLSKYDRAALHFGLESLETRRMLAVSASVSNGTLNITGTSGNDTITVNKKSNGKVAVNGNGNFSGFTKISINAGNGNDNITINNNVPYASSVISASG